MRLLALLALLALCLLSSGCSRNELDCGSDDAVSTVVPLLKERIERLTRDGIRGEDGARVASNAEVRALVARLAIAIADIRTTNRDPNSTKRFCSGTLRVTIPTDVIDEAERTRRDTGDDTITALADRNDVDQNANVFSAEIDYNVQPTDDQARVFAQVDTANHVYQVVSSILVSQLSSRAVREARAQQENEMAEQRRQEEQQAREQDEAAAEQRAATVAQARVDLQLTEQQINEIWQSIPRSTRSALLEQQRAWNRRKTADCRVEAAGASVDPTERDVARMRCEGRLNQQRSSYLRQYIGVESSSDMGQPE